MKRCQVRFCWGLAAWPGWEFYRFVLEQHVAIFAEALSRNDGMVDFVGVSGSGHGIQDRALRSL